MSTTTRFTCAVLLLTIFATPRTAAVIEDAPIPPDSLKGKPTSVERRSPLRVELQTRSALQDSAFRRSELYSELVKMQRRHPDIGAVVGLNAEFTAKLLDLMAEHNLEWLDLSLQRQQRLGRPDSNIADGEPLEEALIARQNAAVKQLLGAAGFWRYHEYMRTLWQRDRLQSFTELLPQRPLTREQVESMVQTLAQHDEERDYLAYRDAQYAESRDVEQILMQRRALDTQLLQATAQILDAQQQAVFANWHMQPIAMQRAELDDAHLDARSKTAQAAATAPALTIGPGVAMRWRLRVSVNQTNPQTLIFKSATRNKVQYTTPEGLLIEATPVVDATRTLRVRVKVFETDSTGQHFIGSVYRSSPPRPTRARDPQEQAVVLNGSQSYALSVSVAAIDD